MDNEDLKLKERRRREFTQAQQAYDNRGDI